MTNERNAALWHEWAKQSHDPVAERLLELERERDAEKLVADQAVEFHGWLGDVAEALSGTRLRTVNDLAVDVERLRAERDELQDGLKAAEELFIETRVRLDNVRESLKRCEQSEHVLSGQYNAALARLEKAETEVALIRVFRDEDRARVGRYRVTLRSVGGEIVQQAEFRPGESIVWDTHENPARVYQVEATYLPPETS